MLRVHLALHSLTLIRRRLAFEVEQEDINEGRLFPNRLVVLVALRLFVDRTTLMSFRLERENLND